MTLRSAFAAALMLVTALPVQAQLKVFACEPEWAALVQELVPDAQLTTATSHLQDPHYIEARPSLIAAVRRADIAVCTGASLEAGWLPMLLERASNPDIQSGRPGLFFAADHAQLHAPHDHVDRSMGDVHPEGNPHVHLSPDQLPEIARALARQLGDVDPEAAAAIQGRYIRWRGDWNRLRSEWRDRAEAIEGQSVVVQHSNYLYLLRWLGVDVAADLEPKPGLPPSASHLSGLLAEPGLADASAILVASYQDPQPAEWLAEQTGLPVIVVPGTVTGDASTETLGGLIGEIIGQLESVRSGATHGSL
ncbi:metal ABC transporter substrate-binding protein [Marinobacter sp. F3R08]|uniref:metal ABC transporter substrate-binding protein n=1 Tax=Marinobacter sp. F3R08 TaxID=2841559 RepID=UPI001C07FFE5|nr:zinc ABC transporter substrate-binding protein [Marinobacter sp. F3R08]MBU2953383.1 zinc ABC transporter substrate-binding protein [Marinobacter sp. F3R08]